MFALRPAHQREHILAEGAVANLPIHQGLLPVLLGNIKLAKKGNAIAVGRRRFMVSIELVLMPIDMFVNTVFKRTGRKWGDIKTTFDCSLLLLSAVIGLLFLGGPKFIREGTFMNAILVGQYIKLYFYLFHKTKATFGTHQRQTLERQSS